MFQTRMRRYDVESIVGKRNLKCATVYKLAAIGSGRLKLARAKIDATGVKASASQQVRRPAVATPHVQKFLAVRVYGRTNGSYKFDKWLIVFQCRGRVVTKAYSCTNIFVSIEFRLVHVHI